MMMHQRGKPPGAAEEEAQAQTKNEEAAQDEEEAVYQAMLKKFKRQLGGRKMLTHRGT